MWGKILCGYSGSPVGWVDVGDKVGSCTVRLLARGCNDISEEEESDNL